MHHIWGNSKLLPLAVLLVSILLLRIFILFIYKKRNTKKGKDNFSIGINTITYLLSSVIVVIAVLVILKVNVRGLFTSVSIIAAAIAIISKDYISNAINGMILMFNNQITIGDYIRLGTYEGKITHISLMNIQLTNENDDIVFIPNNMVMSNEFVNLSKGEVHKTSLEIIANASKFQNIEELEAYFTQVIPEIKTDVIEGTFRIRVIKIKSKTLTLKVQATLRQQDRVAERRFVRKVINAWVARMKE